MSATDAVDNVLEAAVALVKAKCSAKGRPFWQEANQYEPARWSNYRWTRRELELFVAVKEAGLL
jgi:hypothetical protein